MLEDWKRHCGGRVGKTWKEEAQIEDSYMQTINYSRIGFGSVPGDGANAVERGLS
jgi:hypothetical protein